MNFKYFKKLLGNKALSIGLPSFPISENQWALLEENLSNISSIAWITKRVLSQHLSLVFTFLFSETF